MFHFMDDQQGNQQGQDMPYGDRLVGRILSAEYNLAVQRGDAPQAADALAKILGMFLNEKFR
jgi:hypothetical protein